MRSDTPLDYAVFQLSPERSRCEMFVSGNGSTEKLASGLLKPFVTHLAVAEEQVSQDAQSIKLEVDKCNESTWFTKGTLERFVRFVSTPEVLELVHTFDAEMSQLEAARRIYLQGSENQLSGDSLGAEERGAYAVADVTKKELLRAIDVRLAAVRQDLTMACARASAAGFTPDTVSGLQLFSDRFGAHRLNEACIKFISVNQRRPDLINPWKARVDDRAVRSSSGSDMSIDDQSEENALLRNNGPHRSLPQRQPPHRHHQRTQSQINQEQDTTQCLEESEASTCQQLKTFATFSTQGSLRGSSSERDDQRESGGTVEKEETMPEAPQTSKLSRRLSVQDRINMFENKQKEQTQGSGGKVMVGKSVELRRLSSDVSSAGQLAEKAVLRRWSGVSDMSLDLSNEKKEPESSESTPGSTSNRQSQTFPSADEDSEIGESQGKAKSYESELRGLPVVEDFGVKDGAIAHSQVEDLPPSKEVAGSKEYSSKAAGLSDQLTFQPQMKACSTRTKNVDWKDHKGSDVDLKDQPPSQTRSGSCGSESIELKKGSALQTLVRASSTGGDHTSGQVASQAQFRAFLDHAEDVALKNRTVSQVHSKASIIRTDDLLLGDEPQEAPQKAFPSRTTDGRLRDQLASQAPTRASPSSAINVGSDPKEKLASELQSRPFSGKVKVGLGAKNQTASQAQGRGFIGELSASQIPRSLEETGNMEFGGFPVKEEEYSLQGIKLQRQSSAPEQNSKFHGRKGGSTPTYGNSGPIFSQRKVIESVEMDESIPTEVCDQVQKIRLTKGNQELNDELQVKANELEKLFAAHKLRVPPDQSTTTRRSKPAEMQMEQVSSTIYSTPGEVTPNQFQAIPTTREPFDSKNAVMRTPDNQEYSNALKQNISELVFPEISRGKFYDSYMQKRNAKLREEWNLKGDQKEAKMKAMQDSFERSRVEMETKFAGSSDRRDSSLYARQRAEKLRSFNMRLIMKNREQHPIDILRLDGDGDPLEFSEQNQYEQAGSFGERLVVDGSSRFSQSKKSLHKRTSSSSSSRTSAAPVPRSSTKSSNSSSGRRRVQAENPLAQSVPNFSDFRKENTKPSSGTSKTTTRTQFRNYARSKSINEDSPVVKEDKSQRSQSMRKSFVIPADLKDLSPLNSDVAILAQLKLTKEQIEPSVYGKLSRSGESKPFLKKGNGIGPGAGAGIAKLKASMAPEILKSDEESDDMTDQLEDSVDLVKEEEGCEREIVDEALQVVDYASDSDNENLIMSGKSESYGDLALENGNVLESFSEVDPDSVAEMAAAVPSKFYSSMGPQQDSPEESPVSWNSHALHPFSYAHETSDVDASMDSPIGSPASWNSHSLTEADAARMRKKWGSAQKPILVANSSHHQSRKDVTRGFKRLLKFGRKSRGTESLVDWISATTSEGDDDTEDGRDLASRSSEDLRKSRMGLSQDVLNDGELFNEQVQALRTSIPTAPSNFKLREDHLSGSSLKGPRSFFSLSTFRSKGSESKPR